MQELHAGLHSISMHLPYVNVASDLKGSKAHTMLPAYLTAVERMLHIKVARRSN